MLPRITTTTTAPHGYDLAKPKKLFGSPFATQFGATTNGRFGTPIKKFGGERDQSNSYVGVLVILLVVAIVVGKLLQLTMDVESIAIKDAFIHSWKLSQTIASEAWLASRQTVQNIHIEPSSILMCAIAATLVSLFSWTIIYLDSDVPGINPPTPSFSPRKNSTSYREHVQSSYSLGYLMTIINGVAVFAYLLIHNN